MRLTVSGLPDLCRLHAVDRRFRLNDAELLGSHIVIERMTGIDRLGSQALKGKRSIIASFQTSMRSRFLKQVLALSSGTAIAQAMALGFLPVLTRLYTPDDFGVLTLYVSIASLLYVFGSLRYEMTIMLPHSHRAAAQLVRLVFFISVGAALFSLLIVLLFNRQIAAWLGNPEVALWLYFLPVSLFFFANYQALRYWVMRLQKFGIVSRGMIARTSTNLLSATGIKLAGFPLPPGGGLVIGAILAELVNAAWLFFGCRKRDRVLFENIRQKSLYGMAKRHAPMAATLTVSHGIATLNSRLPSLMISAFFGPASLGLFGVAERIATAPSQLIAASIGDVYRQRASVLYRGTSRFDRLLLKTLVMTSALAIVPYGIGIWFAPDIFRILLGPQWEEAGRYASIILVGGFFSFVITPIDKGAIIVDAKGFIFAWHLLGLAAQLILLGFMFIRTLSIYQILWLLVSIRVSLYLLELVMEYRYASGK